MAVPHLEYYDKLLGQWVPLAGAAAKASTSYWGSLYDSATNVGVGMFSDMFGSSTNDPIEAEALVDVNPDGYPETGRRYDMRTGDYNYTQTVPSQYWRGPIYWGAKPREARHVPSSKERARARPPQPQVTERLLKSCRPGEICEDFQFDMAANNTSRPVYGPPREPRQWTPLPYPHPIGRQIPAPKHKVPAKSFVTASKAPIGQKGKRGPSKRRSSSTKHVLTHTMPWKPRLRKRKQGPHRSQKVVRSGDPVQDMFGVYH